MNRNIKDKCSITKTINVSYVLKISILLILTIIWMACKQQITERNQKVEYVYNQYENGTLKEIGILQDSVKQGLWITFYSTGKIEFIFFYKDGKKTGPQRMFREDGSLSGYAEMSNDMFNGKRISYYHGDIVSESHWINDTPHGLFIEYDVEGDFSIHEYKDGEFVRTIVGTPPPIIEE
ncbi:MAG: hypothetical protein LBJ63_05530 [Prevotellaceae bacterium]|jgi:antitoxin component YwqK of YwqJK toxin-antitoxin module|nr:hypothetical protein [Prevotellaceae bacterium]